MMSRPMTVLAFVLLMIPVLVRADFSADHIGQSSDSDSLLIQPPVAFLSHEPAPIMFLGPRDATHLGFAIDYVDSSMIPVYRVEEPHQWAQLYSATAIGEYAVNEWLGLFGTFGLRYSSGQDNSLRVLADSAEHLPQMDHRYGVGVNVRASDVLSLHFEWERFAQGSDSKGANLSNSAWDPWNEMSVFGAGMRLGF